MKTWNGKHSLCATPPTLSVLPLESQWGKPEEGASSAPAQPEVTFTAFHSTSPCSGSGATRVNTTSPARRAPPAARGWRPSAPMATPTTTTLKLEVGLSHRPHLFIHPLVF